MILGEVDESLGDSPSHYDMCSEPSTCALCVHAWGVVDERGWPDMREEET